MGQHPGSGGATSTHTKRLAEPTAMAWACTACARRARNKSWHAKSVCGTQAWVLCSRAGGGEKLALLLPCTNTTHKASSSQMWPSAALTSLCLQGGPLSGRGGKGQHWRGNWSVAPDVTNKQYPTTPQAGLLYVRYLLKADKQHPPARPTPSMHQHASRARVCCCQQPTQVSRVPAKPHSGAPPP